MQKQNRGDSIDNKNKKCRRITERNTFKVTKRASGRRKTYLSELSESEWNGDGFIRFYDTYIYIYVTVSLYVRHAYLRTPLYVFPCLPRQKSCTNTKYLHVKC
jgi:hypothetical protein